MYEKPDIRKQKIASEKLDIIKNKIFKFIKNNIGKISEYDVKEYVVEELAKEGMISDSEFPIIACDENTSYMHYFPEKSKSKIIKEDCLVMIDLWAKLIEGGYYADITWMCYTGKRVPGKIKNIFDQVIEARDYAVDYIGEKLRKAQIPKGCEVDNAVRKFFGNNEKYFIHGLGHSLGFYNAHGGLFNLNKKCDKKIQIGVPFTIEPALYFENEFGIRSEINCYVNEDYKLLITSSVQDEIVLV